MAERAEAALGWLNEDCWTLGHPRPERLIVSDLRDRLDRGDARGLNAVRLLAEADPEDPDFIAEVWSGLGYRPDPGEIGYARCRPEGTLAWVVRTVVTAITSAARKTRLAVVVAMLTAAMRRVGLVPVVPPPDAVDGREQDLAPPGHECATRPVHARAPGITDPPHFSREGRFPHDARATEAPAVA